MGKEGRQGHSFGSTPSRIQEGSPEGTGEQSRTTAQDQAAPPVGESQEQGKAKPKEEKGEGDEKAKVDESRNAEGRNGVVSSTGSRVKMGFLVVALVVAFGAYAAYNYQYFINWTEK
ncbi:uncharacterized protein LOC117920947 isoform X2 [Vitis riparia]|uniref:uncharacterized protein LOC117920947 isoform X2 n=1 Tax=Vitis riparia TaxID=96939 RepID=UPI00155A28DC|nr:uncharacterized protein LOC117920947 isoform X2 [Vitis riparia]